MGKTKRRGFTLIELLVVISIVSLLSSVVLAALNSARTKADDTARNEIVGEYVKALTLAYDAAGTGQYPGTADNTQYCLGNYSPASYGTLNICRYGLAASTRSENSTVENALDDYLTNLPTLKPVVLSTSVTYDGPFYKCSATDCSAPSIEWYLQQSGQKCIKGAVWQNFSTGTQCILPLQ